MAKVTSDCFDKCEQSDKYYFAGYFEDLWQCCDSSRDINMESTRVGFEELIVLLNKLYDNYMYAGRKIAAAHTKTFISTVNNLIQKLDSAISRAN